MLIATFVFAQAAKADDGVPGGLGQGNQTYVPSPQNQQLLQEKQQLADSLLLVEQGKLTTAAYQQKLNAFYKKHGIKPPTSTNAQINAVHPNGYPGSKIFASYRQIAQSKSYYCGPGTAEAMLNYLGHDTSQSTLASTSYLHTDANGGTNYGDNVMAYTLNTLGSTGDFYAQKNVSSLSTYEGDLVADIYAGYPVAIAAYENGTYNLNSTEIGWYHWFSVRGYAASGGTSYVADPASGMWNVPAYDTENSSIIQGVMANGGFGYVW